MRDLAQSRELLGKLPWFLLLVVVIFVLRSLVTFPVEHHDATLKYYFAAKIARAGDWSLLLTNHHTMRWAEMVPQASITWLVNMRYEALYIYSLLAFSVSAALILRGLRTHLSVRELLIVLGLFFIDPLWLMHNGQMMNPPFGVLFAFAGITALLGPGNKSKAGIVLSAAFFFCAYGSHVTYLSFAAGSFIWLAWHERKLGNAILFAVTMLVLFLIETIGFNLLSGGELKFGRIEALSQGKHVQWVYGKFKPVEYHHLFKRWLWIPVFDQVLSLGFAICCIWFAFSKQLRKRTPDFVRLTLLTGSIYALSITFAIAGFNPLRPAMPLLPMYLEPFFPFAIVGSVWLYSQLATRIGAGLRWKLELSAGLLMCVMLTLFVLKKGDLDRILNNRLNAFMWISERELGDFADRFNRGELLLVGRNRMSLSFVVRYRYPKRVFWNKENDSVSTFEPLPDALCLTHIRRIPLERNYNDCKDIKFTPRRKRTPL